MVQSFLMKYLDSPHGEVTLLEEQLSFAWLPVQEYMFRPQFEDGFTPFLIWQGGNSKR